MGTIVNIDDWEEGSINTIYILLFFSVLFIAFGTIIALFKPSPNRNKKIHINWKEPKEIWGMGICVVALTLFSCIFIPIVPFPSTIILVIFVFNGVLATVSLLLHPAIIYSYELNVYGEAQTVHDYVYKYVALITSNVNYRIQLELSVLPYVVNKLLALLFVAYIVWMASGFIITFGE